MNNTKIGLWKHVKNILIHNSWYKNQSPVLQFIYLWAKFNSDNVLETSVRYRRQNWWFLPAIWSAKFNVNPFKTFGVKTWRLYVQFLITELPYTLHVRSHGGRQCGFKGTEIWKQINIYYIPNRIMWWERTFHQQVLLLCDSAFDWQRYCWLRGHWPWSDYISLINVLCSLFWKAVTV